MRVFLCCGNGMVMVSSMAWNVVIKDKTPCETYLGGYHGNSQVNKFVFKRI